MANIARRIERRSLHEEIVPQLREMVVAGRWKANETLPELALSEELGVSRTPVREAVKILAAEGLLQVRPRSGASIKILNPQEVSDLFEAAGVIEAAGARLAVERASAAEMRRIAGVHERMVAAYQQSDRTKYFELNQRIHSMIVAAAHNAVLSEQHTKLLMRMRRIRYACTNDVGRWQGAIEEHGAILDALMKRDGERLSRLLIAHMGKGWERVRDFVRTEYANS